jgi:NAD(P)-binding Rossmann-like domain
MILTDLAPFALLFVPWWLLLLLVVAGSLVAWLMHWPGSNVKLKISRASPFSPHLVPSSVDTIVIGSGSGGCACANILAQSGQRVLILEQHEDRTGGCTHTFRLDGCEFDSGLHYTSEGMSLATHRAGAFLKFMTKGKQEWRRLDDPYDQVLFPVDNSNVAPGRPNCNDYEFNTGRESVIRSVVERIDPGNKDLENKCTTWMELCDVVNDGFTALGESRVIPFFLHFLLPKRHTIEHLYKLASYTVRDVQYAVFNRGYSVEDLLHDCPKAPEGNEPDAVLRRVKGVLNHPIGVRTIVFIQLHKYVGRL